MNDDFATQRNFGLSKAKGEWVLFIDADERVSKGLADEIVNFVHDPGSVLELF
jgi:glycosyltransferase involved in cell wall biosynthesis